MGNLKIIGSESDSFSIESARSSGGKTGSVCVTGTQGTYQYKPSITQNTIKRRAKSAFADSENFGEVIAARIAKEFDIDRTHPRVPSVFFVTDDTSPYVGIASKYLRGETVQSLDDYLGKPSSKVHIKLVSGNSSPENGIYNIDQDPVLKKELAWAVGMSALCADHDVNPGNMIVIKNGDKLRVGRIDYGHAFKDLMRFSSFGGKKVHQNNILDFFNRKTLDGFPSVISKLWRDYPGLVPSAEMAEVLKNLGSQENFKEKVEKALDEVKDEIKFILDKPNIDKRQIIYSLERIARHVSGKKISSSLGMDEKIKAIFDHLSEYTIKNIGEMKYIGKLMDIQVRIQNAVKQQDENTLAALRREFMIQHSKAGIEAFTWIKETDNLPAFKGTFSDYVNYQKNLLKFNQSLKEIDGFLADKNISKDEFLRVKGLKSLMSNPKKSIKDKLLLLEQKIEILDSVLKVKSTSLTRLINNALSLILKSKKPAPLTVNSEAIKKFQGFKQNIQRTLSNKDNINLNNTDQINIDPKA